MRRGLSQVWSLQSSRSGCPWGRLWALSLGADSPVPVPSRGVSSMCVENSLPLLIMTPVLLDGGPTLMTSFILKDLL